MRTDDLFPRNGDLRNILQRDCSACSLHRGRNRISWGYGPIPCKLMLIGEAPARGDAAQALWKGSNYTGIPFTNVKSGAKLRRLMRDLGVELSLRAYVTNIVKCYPGCAADTTGNPSLKRLGRCHFDACGAHLSKELDMVAPDLVVCVGSYPWKHFNRLIGRDAPKLSECVMSEPAFVEGRGFRVMGMFHPARWDSWVKQKTPGEAQYRRHLRDMITTAL